MLLRLLIFSLLLFSHCKNPLTKQKTEELNSAIYEVKFSEIADDKLSKYEASGLVYTSERIYVVFDNTERIASFTFKNKKVENISFFGSNKDDSQFEAISFGFTDKPYLFIAEESRKEKGEYIPYIHIYDTSGNKLDEFSSKVPLKKENKGFEGLAFTRRLSHPQLVALCEGEGCGKAYKNKKGILYVFGLQKNKWKKEAVIELPYLQGFSDYSDIALLEDKVAITSQEGSYVWIGEFMKGSWKLKNKGLIYAFPRGKQKELLYCNIEGVSWIDETTLAFVSDKAKKSYPKSCKTKSEMFHVFILKVKP
ncbi:MAG: hypothetical protein H7A25_07535 [Leptospiraceae bacterium]|nr:hypothetical protein [Leptospiraceae bacterium]